MSWEKVNISAVSEQIRGVSYNPSDLSDMATNNHIPVLRANNVTENGIKLDDLVYVNTKRISKNQVLKSGDILIVASSGSKTIVGRAISIEKDMDASFGAFCKIVRPKSKVDKRYLGYYFRSADYRRIISHLSAGANINNLRSDDINTLQIPLPALHIQKQIANILDKADALRKKDQQLLQKYDDLAQSIFIDMFGDPVKNEKGWPVQKLGDCLERIQIGPFGTQLHASDYVTNGIPVINPMHIGDLKIKPNYAYSITKQKFEELPQYHLQKDDVILARRGEMGRCAIVTKLEAGFLCGTGSLFLTTSKEKLDPVFLVYLISRNSTKLELEKFSAGTTMANLNKTIINNFNIISPPISNQRIFKQSIQNNQEMIRLLQSSINQSENLFQSLLQKAFTGELIVDSLKPEIAES